MSFSLHFESDKLSKKDSVVIITMFYIAGVNMPIEKANIQFKNSCV